MSHHDVVVCEIIAKHNFGIDIESIARELRLKETEEKWDIHYVGSLIGCYVSNLARIKNTFIDTVYPETACKSNGIISAGTGSFLMCPMFRKPNDREVVNER